jgi:hypothetical protein
MRSNLRACKARQATRKDSDEKRRGAFEHTRPFVSMTSYSPASKDQQQ